MSEERTFRRRVQLVGGSALAITLPKAWAKKYGIEPGTEINLFLEVDGCLKICPPGFETRKKTSVSIELDPSTDPNTIVRLVIAHYLAGYHAIKLVYQPHMRKKVEEALEVLKAKVMGLEVLDEDSSSTTLYTVVDPEFVSFDSVLRRLARITLSMLYDLGNAFRSRDLDLLESIARRDDLVDKLYLLAMKQLHEKLSNPLESLHPLEAIYLSMALKCIERVADHARTIALLLQRCSSEVPTNVIDLYGQVVELFRESMDALTNFDLVKAIEVAKAVDKAKEVENRVRESIQRIDVCTDHVLEGIRRILAYSIDVAELVIDIVTARKYVELTPSRNEERGSGS